VVSSTTFGSPSHNHGRTKISVALYQRSRSFDAVGLRRAIAWSGSERGGVPDVEIRWRKRMQSKLQSRRTHVTGVDVLTVGEAVGRGCFVAYIAEARVSEQWVRRSRTRDSGTAVAVAHEHDWRHIKQEEVNLE
jgi:hypothetical protein